MGNWGYKPYTSVVITLLMIGRGPLCMDVYADVCVFKTRKKRHNSK